MALVDPGVWAIIKTVEYIPFEAKKKLYYKTRF